jgi:hypothetical protein
MIKAEILEALPKLNAEERRQIRAKLEGGKDSGLCWIQHKADHVGLSDYGSCRSSCALSLSRPASAGVWSLSNPTAERGRRW